MSHPVCMQPMLKITGFKDENIECMSDMSTLHTLQKPSSRFDTGTDWNTPTFPPMASFTHAFPLFGLNSIDLFIASILGPREVAPPRW